MDRFIYDDETHQYWELGKDGEYFRIPSVTEVCKPILNYDNVPSGVLEEACKRGDDIHETIRMHRDGTLDESKLEEGNKICLDAYKEWWHKERQDFFGLIVDIKTRKPNIPYDSVQLAGYGLLANTKLGLVERGLIDIEKPLFNPKLHFGGTPDYVEYNPESIAKYILYLKPKGGYEFVNAERNQATSLFRILLKKWWTDFDTQVIIEKWRKNK